MSQHNVGPIGLICMIGVLTSPIINGVMKGPQLDKTNSNVSGVYRGQSIEAEIVDIGKSSSGFKYCKFYVKSIEKIMLGPCSTTDEKTKFNVGNKYLLTKFDIGTGGNNITVNSANEISAGAKVKVVRVFNRAGTRLAELSDGSIVGGDNLNSDSYVYR